MSRMRAWLERHRLLDRLEVLDENDVDLEVLPELTEDDLREMGFSIGHRRRFFKALEEDPPGEDRADDGGPEIEPEETAERRQMTVMFCDLVGSTELASRLDPEETSALLQRYTTEVSQAIVERGGHVAKFLGDGVLAYFGWPRADEDAASRAVEAGLAIATRVAGLEGPAGPLAARVGIATGPVIVSDLRGEGTTERNAIAGPTPNLAARLEGRAGPSEVVIHDVTRRLIGALFDLEPRGAARLKGFSEPVAIWRVLARARATSRFDARAGTGLTTFVGRDSERGLLADRWARASSGDGQAVLLSGEAGIGKSRILRELRRDVSEGGEAAIVQIQCAPDEIDTAFSPLLRELATSAELHPEEPVAARSDRLDTYLRQVFPDPETAGALLAGLVGLPADRYPALEIAPQRRQLATITHLAQRLRQLSAAGPVLVLFEDIHWADPSSLATLDALVSGLDDAPLLVVATARPGPQPGWTGNGNATSYSLNRLSREAVIAIAHSAAGGKALPQDVLGEILARTDGVPLFVEELTKAIIEAGLLKVEDNRFVLTAPLPPLAIPSTL